MILPARIARWVFFFVIAVGLGYPAVFRYAPPTIGGLSDTAQYFEMAEQGVGAGNGRWKYRILIPGLARPLRSLLLNATGRPESTAAAMLVVEAAFVATTAEVTFLLAIAIGAGASIAATAALVWLCSFPVANYQLAGMVDSVEALAVALTLLAGATGRWPLIMAVPLLALGKDTSVPLAVSAAAGFIAYRCLRHEPYLRAVAWTAAAAALGVGSMAIAHLLVDGSWIDLAGTIAKERSSGSFLGMLWPSLFNRGTFYIFIALLPAALAGRRGVPAPLWVAGCFAALAALALGAWSLSDATKTNAARRLFSAIGPVLAIAAAAWLAGNPLRHSRDVAPRR